MKIYRSILSIGVRSTITSRPLRTSFQFARTMATIPNGDLNNTSAERARTELDIDPAYQGRSLAIPPSEDDVEVRKAYRPFILEGKDAEDDWVAELELSTALKMVDTQLLQRGDDRLRVVVLHGSMRSRYRLLPAKCPHGCVQWHILTPGRSYSRLLSYEASRILFRLGCDVRMYDPTGLPVKDDVQHTHPKVQELRELSKWSDGHIWICPEQHGTLVSWCPKTQYAF